MESALTWAHQSASAKIDCLGIRLQWRATGQTGQQSLGAQTGRSLPNALSHDTAVRAAGGSLQLDQPRWDPARGRGLSPSRK